MDKISIIKIGGNIIDDESRLASFIKDFAQIDGHKILVHGGGKMATSLATQLGIPQKMIDGRRVTDADTLRVVTMVYAGLINKNIVSMLQAWGCNAFGLTGADGNLILSHKRNTALDYGFAGDVDAVNVSLLSLLLEKNALVVAPITHDGKGQLLNTNADTIAQELAKALHLLYEVHLIYSFEKEGVLLDVTNEDSLIPHLSKGHYKRLKEEGNIHSGMIPKLDNAFAALHAGVTRITIGKADKLHHLISGKAGTTITNE